VTTDSFDEVANSRTLWDHSKCC